MQVDQIYALDETTLDALSIELPFYACVVQAGFPSPADDSLENVLQLADLLVKNPTATFFVRVSGDSMINAGIHDGDILVVDRSLTPFDGKVVIAVVNGECTVKRIRYEQNRAFLVAENEIYAPIELSEFSQHYVWGVVTSVIHRL